MKTAEQVEHCNQHRGKTHIRNIDAEDEDEDLEDKPVSADELASQVPADGNMNWVFQVYESSPTFEAKDVFVNNINQMQAKARAVKLPAGKRLPDWAFVDSKFLNMLHEATRKAVCSDRNEHFDHHPDQLADAATASTSSLTSAGSTFNLEGPQHPAKNRNAKLSQQQGDKTAEALPSAAADAQIAAIQSSLNSLTERLKAANILRAHASVSCCRFAGLASTEDDTYICALDNGADAAVLGRGWTVADHVTCHRS